MSRHHNNLPKAPVNLATGSVQFKIESNPLLDLVYYNRYSNSSGPSSPNNNVGNNWNARQLARLSEINDMVVVNFAPGRRGKTYWFKRVNNSFQPQFSTRAKLTMDSISGNFRVVETSGNVCIFDSWSGSLIQAIAPNGVITDYIANAQQQIKEIRTQSGTGVQTVVESRVLSYFNEGPNWGQLHTVTQRRAVGSPNPVESDFTLLRRLELEYYSTDQSDRGSVNDLKHVHFQTLTDGQWQTNKTQYFRYYTDSQGAGFRCGLKYALSSTEFACALKEHNPTDDANFDADQISDTDLSKIAGIGFCYNDQQRACNIMRDGGRIENTVEYSENPNPGSDQHNHWIRKAVYTATDGSVKTVYANRSGKDILVDDIDADGVRWIEYRRFNNRGQRIEKVTSSAIDIAMNAYDASAADLNVQIKPNEGLIELTSYHQNNGKINERSVKKGSAGIPVKLNQRAYVTHSIGSGSDERSVDRISSQMVYRSESGAGDPVETTYTYQLHAGTLQPSRITTHLANVPSSQNGSSFPQNETTVDDFNVLGRKVRHTDARGIVTEYEYDLATGARIREVQDVGGLNIVTDIQVDDRGRTIETLGPVHVADGQSVRTATWTVHKSEFETWTARGYQTAAGAAVLVNPVQIERRSTDGMIQDSISAARGTTVESPGRLTKSDSFPRSTWQAWSQTHSDVSGRTVESRVYHKIPTSGEGAAGTDYTPTGGDYVYDDLGRQISVTNADNMISRTVYNALGQVESTWTGSNATGAVPSSPNGNGATGNDMVLLSSHTYDSTGLLQLTITPQNEDSTDDRQTRYQYDWRQRQIATIATGPQYDLISRQTLNNQGVTIEQETASVDRSGSGDELLIARSESHLDRRGRTYRTIQHGVDQETGTLTGETVVANMYYNATGQLVKQQSGSVFTLFTHDSLGRQLTQQNSLGQETSTAYNPVGQAITQTDACGHTTTHVYDAVGRMVKTINPLNQSSGQPTFGLDGRVAVQADPVGNETGYQYDAAGRTTKVIDAEGHETETVYYPSGRVHKTIDAAGKGTVFEYDLWGRQSKITDAQNDSVQFFYDRAGNLVTQIDAKGNSTAHQYDLLGRRSQTTDRLNGVTRFQFDRAGREAAKVDAEDNATHYRYDAFGRLAETEYPDHGAGSQPGDLDYGIVCQAYDDHGRIKLRVDQKGDSVTFNYDAAGRLESRDYRTAAGTPAGTIADSDTFTYNANGQILTATSGRYGNTVTFTYDDAARQQSETLTVDGQSYQTTTAYDATSRVESLTYPDGSLVQRSYDSRGQLHTLKLDGAIIDTRTYDARGRLQQSTYGNGVVTDFQYRDDGLVSEIATTNSGTQKIGTYAYAYDANKNKAAETITGAGLMNAYGFGQAPTQYDNENRLTGWNRDDNLQNQAWQLSPVGVWNEFSENNLPTAYVHNEVHELTKVGNQSINHDANGNQLQTAASVSLTWDQDNRLTNAGNHGFEYDALGRRVGITEAGGTKILICAGQQLIATYASGATASNPTSRFVYGSYIDEPVLMKSGSQQYYYSRNQQFSITALTDVTGEVVQRYAYDAYGNTMILAANGNVQLTSSIDNPFTYTGRYYHPEIGLMYFRARYYDTQTGEFISRDPLEYVDGMSLYRAYFVPGKVDPSGNCNGKPSGAEYVAGRGSFRAIQINELQLDDYFDRIGSTMNFSWNTESSEFTDEDCCCCTRIGFVQTVKETVAYNVNHNLTGHGNSASWEIDAAIPYPASDTKDPCQPDVRFITFRDNPNAPKFYRGFGWQLGFMKQDFEVCAVCLSGDEGPSSELSVQPGTNLVTSLYDGFTTYGCLKWGHEISWDRQTNRYNYKRYLGNTVSEGTAVSSRVFLGEFGGNAPSANWRNSIIGSRVQR